MNLDLLKHAKDYIFKMANGINPLTGESVSDSDLINNVKVSRCLFYVNNILEEILLNGGISKSKSKKIKFYMDRETINKYEIVDYDLPISKIVKKINDLKITDEMKNLKTTDVTKWLMNIGLLEEVLFNDKKRKKPTDLGKSMGMYIEHRVGMHGGYDIVIYKRNMQEFIIDNFENLLDFINQENS